MHMRTTLNLDDELMRKAMDATGIREKTRLVHRGLESLLREEAAMRLARLGGSQPQLPPFQRKRPWPARAAKAKGRGRA